MSHARRPGALVVIGALIVLGTVAAAAAVRSAANAGPHARSGRLPSLHHGPEPPYAFVIPVHRRRGPGVALTQATAAAVQGPAARAAQDDQEDNVAYSGRYTITRIRYTPTNTRMRFYGRRGGPGWLPEWAHDYPRAERHLARIVGELTSIEPVLDASNIFTSDDPELMKFPIVYLCEAGYWQPTDAEVQGMRNYLLKGGFVIFDDFRGPRDWDNFQEQIRRILPEGRIVELTAKHPIFHSFFDVDSLNFQAPTYRQYTPVFYGLYRDADTSKPLLAIINFDNDVSEYWEWSDTGYLPIDLSNEAYKLGINYIVYAMTH